MIEGSGVPLINRITRIDHITLRANPTKGAKGTHGCPCGAGRLGSGAAAAGLGARGWAADRQRPGCGGGCGDCGREGWLG